MFGISLERSTNVKRSEIIAYKSMPHGILQLVTESKEEAIERQNSDSHICQEILKMREIGRFDIYKIIEDVR